MASERPGQALADVGQRRLTVMCCDLVGSTALSEHLDPEEWREVMRAYQHAATAVVSRFGGHLAQYQGDALLVYFGYVVAQPDDAERAVHAGMGVLAALDEVNARIGPAHGVRLAVRIGIDTGMVVVGRTGLALGDTPAAAAALQAGAAPDTVVVSPATAELVGDAFVCERAGGGVTVRAARISPAPAAGAAAGRDDTGADEAERRQLTVMFCGLADPGALAPEALLAAVPAFQQACAASIATFDGHIAQWLEHGLLVYFGFPRAHEDDAQRAVRAALGIVTALPGLGVAARIGIHTGQVVAGVMGGAGRTEQLAVGPTPNVAARIQALAVPDTVTISATTARLVEARFVLEDLGPRALKGVAEPVGVSRVVAEIKALRTDALAALVGREAELARLMDLWAQAESGNGQCVLIDGEAGIGKSRLVAELGTLVGASTVFSCSPYHTNSALHPFAAYLDRTPDERLAALLAAPTETPALRERAQAAIADWLRDRGGVVLWEDLHWVDPSTLDVLGRLVERSAGARLLAVFTTRPGFAPPWPVATLTLRRLSHPLVREIVSRVTHGRALPAEVLAQIVEKTDGVPLFVEELTKAVVASGLVHAVNGNYVLRETAVPIRIPLTLQDALMARIDRLGPAKRVAQVASVIGREFTREFVAAVTEDEAGADRGLAALVDAELAQRDGGIYVFKHALIQDAAYQSLLRRTRQQFHERIARVLAERFPATPPEVLAHHQTEAGHTEPAIALWRSAGERAAQRSASVEAVGHFTRALELLASLPASGERLGQELMLQLALGAPLMAARGYSAPEVGRTFSRARELCRLIGDTPQIFPVLYGLWVFYIVGSALEVAGDLARQCLQVAEGAPGDPGLMLEARVVLGATAFYSGDPAAARAHLEQGLPLHDSARDQGHALIYGTDPRVVGLGFLARSLALLDEPDAARRTAAALRALEPELAAHHNSWGAALMHLTVVHLLLGDGAGARRHAEALIALATAEELPLWLGMATMLCGAARVAEGDELDAAIAQLRAGLVAYRATGAGLDHPLCLGLLARGLGKLGRPAEGLEVVDGALATIAATGERYAEAELRRVRAELTRADG